MFPLKLRTITALLLMLSAVSFTGAMVLAWGQSRPASRPDKGQSDDKPAANAVDQPKEAEEGAKARAKKDGTPKPDSLEELQAAKTKLADLRNAILAKEKELAEMRAGADALDRHIELKRGKTYTKVEELFKGMPKEAYPKAGVSAGIERAAARKWCKANLIGRTIEWTTCVKEVAITGDGPFKVTLHMATELNPKWQLPRASIFDTSISLGGQKCWATLGDPRSSGISYDGCTEAEARKLREFQGKQVKCQAILTDVTVKDQECDCTVLPNGGLPIVLGFGEPTIKYAGAAAPALEFGIRPKK